MDSTEARALTAALRELIACDRALEEAQSRTMRMDKNLRQIVRYAHERIHEARLDAEEEAHERTLKATATGRSAYRLTLTPQPGLTALSAPLRHFWRAGAESLFIAQ